MKRRSFFSAMGLGAFLLSTIGLTKTAPAATGKIEQRLKELNVTLPEAPAPVAAYTAYRIVGNLAYIAGQGPIHSAEHPGVGRVGKDLTTEQAYQGRPHHRL